MDLKSKINLRSGTKMPILALGTWKLTGEDCIKSVKTALELGYRMIDTASNYGNHEQVGRSISESPVPREDIFLVTKVERYDNAYSAVGEYLDQLNLSYADMILIHWPPANGVGEVLWRGLVQAKTEGLTREIGVSNYSIEQMERLIKGTGVIPAVNQIEWTPFGHSNEMLRYCHEKDIVIQAYSPLGHFGKLGTEVINEFAGMYGKTPAQIIIRWNLQHKVVPIIKATSREHLQENINVFDFELSSQNMSILDSLNQHYSALGQKLKYIS